MLFTNSADNPVVVTDDEQMDVKPDVAKLQVTFTTTEDDPIVLSDSDDESEHIKLYHSLLNIQRNRLIVSSVIGTIHAIFVELNLKSRVHLCHTTTISIQMINSNASSVTTTSSHPMAYLSINVATST